MTDASERCSQRACPRGAAAEGLAALLFASEGGTIEREIDPRYHRGLRQSGERIAAAWRRLRPDWFILALIAVVTAASALPCHGAAARVFGALAMIAISALFFLQGARLSREAILAGMTHWRLHLAITSATFALFPLLGIGLIGTAHLPNLLRTGVLFVAVLPSTVQSSIALTSIARGNVAGAVCAASASNLLGMILTPLMLGVLLHLHGGGIDLAGLSKILLQLFVPFAIGHALRPWIGGWADRNRAILAVTDRGSILLVVYTAFSAAVIHGIWSQLPLATLAAIVVADGILLGAGLTIMTLACRLAGMPQSDEVAIVFCGSQKSLVAGVPMANVLFAGPSVGIILVPIMIYHQLQLFVCAWLARRYAASAAAGPAGGSRESSRQIWHSPLRSVPSLMPRVAVARVSTLRRGRSISSR
jgi:solute carrier family 10 (sodium/bile acid cotransporter), member 7